LIDWCLTPTLEIFQLYHGIVHYKKKVLNINGQYNSTNMIKANEPLSSPQIIEHRKRSQNFPKTYPFILKTVITEEICKHIQSYHDYMVV
jgi:hypothetical protein